MTAHELLIAAKGKIPTTETWTQDAHARDANGKPVNATNPAAVSYCSRGAVDVTAHQGGVDAKEYLRAVDALNAAVPSPYYCWSAHEYQDEPEVTHADVLALFDWAIAVTKEAA